VLVDARESAMNDAGDLLLPIQEGAFGPDHVRGELGDVFLGRVPGRTSDDEVTLFKSLGVALEDLAAAHHIWKKATSQGKSLGLEFGGRRVAHSDTRT
jgi:alanine dehydrogenase